MIQGRRYHKTILLSLVTLFLNFFLQSGVKKEGLLLPAMHEIYSSISVLLPLSLKDIEFTKETNKKKIISALEKLEKNGKSLQSHFLSKNKEDYQYVAKNFTRDAVEAKNHYIRSQFLQARFIVHHFVANCIACHTKFQPDHHTNKSLPLFSNKNLAKIPKLNLAQFKTMTRNFQEAEDLYKKAFMEDPAQLNTTRFAEYLKVAIRVNGHIADVESFFNSLLEKHQLNPSTRKSITSSIQALKTARQGKWLQQQNLNTIKKVVAIGKKQIEQGREFEAQVSFIIVSALANRSLTSETTQEITEKSELYYYLGQSERYISDSFWLSESDNYFEEAIKLAPQKPWSKKAYAMLEEVYTLGYTGSSGTHIPDDVLEKLKDLKTLIDKKYY